MKRIAILILPVVLWASLGWGGTALEAPKGTNAIIQVYFSPNGSCTEAVVETLGRAKTTVKVPAYSFTSVPARIEVFTRRGTLPPMGFPSVAGREVTRAQLR